jgi:hypothetical protein
METVKVMVTAMPAVTVHLFGPSHDKKAKPKRSATKRHKKHKCLPKTVSAFCASLWH